MLQKPIGGWTLLGPAGELTGLLVAPGWIFGEGWGPQYQTWPWVGLTHGLVWVGLGPESSI